MPLITKRSLSDHEDEDNWGELANPRLPGTQLLKWGYVGCHNHEQSSSGTYPFMVYQIKFLRKGMPHHLCWFSDAGTNSC